MSSNLAEGEKLALSLELITGTALQLNVVFPITHTHTHTYTHRHRHTGRPTTGCWLLTIKACQQADLGDIRPEMRAFPGCAQRSVPCQLGCGSDSVATIAWVCKVNPRCETMCWSVNRTTSFKLAPCCLCNHEFVFVEGFRVASLISSSTEMKLHVSCHDCAAYFCSSQWECLWISCLEGELLSDS